MRTFLCFILFFCTSTYFLGQNGLITFGTSSFDEGANTIVKYNEFYFIGGYHNNTAMVTKMDSIGNIVWSNSYDFSSHPDYIMELELTFDNYIIGCGYSRTSAGSSQNGFAFKMDLNGVLIWHRNYYPSNYFFSSGIVECTNGNYRVAGTYQNNSNKLNNYIIEFNAPTGDIAWDSVYAQGSIQNLIDETFLGITEHPVSGSSYIPGRFQTGSGQGSYRPSLSMVNSSGELKWSKYYLYNSSNSGGRLYCYSAEPDGDSLILSFGGKNGGVSPPFQAGLIKTDTSGNMSWSKLYSGAAGEDIRCYNVLNVPNGYIVCGFILGINDLLIFKTDKSGNLLWSKKYGDVGSEDVYMSASSSVILLDGNQLVMTGRTNSFSSNYDIFLISVNLTDGALEGGCYDDFNLVQSNMPIYQENYPMLNSSLPINSGVPAVNPSNITFDNLQRLVEVTTDSIVGGDTLMLCEGESVLLGADVSPALDILWSTGSTSQSESINASGTYWVTASGNGGCTIWSDTVYIMVTNISLDLGNDTVICSGSALTLDAFTPQATYLWNTGSNSPDILADTSGTYWVNVSLNGCLLYDTISLLYGSAPPVNLGNDTTFCEPDSVILDLSGSGGSSFLWQDGSTQNTYVVSASGTYSVTVDYSGCSSSDSIYVNVSLLPVLSLGEDTVLCDVSQYTLNAGGPFSLYSWQDGSTNSTFNVINSGQYWVNVTQNGCTASDTVQVTFSSAPVLDLGSDTVFCDISAIQLDATTPGVSGYIWQDGSTQNTFLANSSGTYWVLVSNGICSSQDTVSIEFQTSPTVNLGPDTTICNNTILELTIQQPGNNFMWEDGSSSNIHTISESGLYWINVTNSCGSFTDSLYINLDNCDAILEMPNVFTPNSDGENDVFLPIIAQNIKTYKIDIVNRWGNLMYSSNNYLIGWDGLTPDGRPCSEGTYFWVIEYEDIYSNKAKMHGFLTLIR